MQEAREKEEEEEEGCKDYMSYWLPLHVGLIGPVRKLLIYIFIHLVLSLRVPKQLNRLPDEINQPSNKDLKMDSLSLVIV